MNIWNYDARTKTLLPGGPRQAQVVWNRRGLKVGDPKRYAMPANSTPVAPPDEQAGYVRCFIVGAWVQVRHHRGETVYDVATGAARNIKDTEIGVPAGMTLEKPGPADKWDGQNKQWSEDAAKKAAIDKEADRVAAVEAAQARVVAANPDLAIALGIIEPPATGEGR